jgi:hypothetical protein
VSFSGQRGARCLAAAAILALAPAAPAPASQGEAADSERVQAGVAWEETGAKALDAVILRPLGAMATVAGFGFFAVSSPLAAASQRIGLSWEILVLAPVEYTFERPLGEF